ncbi:hypothetical protein [Cryptosporidium parvum Iowa II]|uniref:Uncharacterized protein n=3 Tax=Cryptosporidium TaxID=5806 RepID=Q5CWS8_CRYPI|nr:hypothetical protein [Cryptosporidium parvum Iowa II]XP_665850.1 hypothetical protein [Cryptosporidium hominis TU502]OLQ16071.1 hypothetical protein ChTU502y2012_316g0065 [Cryptosporidium hominis]QOY41276.1 Uncharacterized protein CPATCC_0015500 [Cryptosporidium parvum]WKS78504.1 hypothetical protein CPCDC_6g3890 [Cryptosporidium sp. 43IA8]EAK89996.1 hypothetical protein cgd6_3890 [Cryptosporidium parvum Iowa II]PPA62432.1 hypothetical protein ChUKH1_12970 [Cryptosporidium hominis]|eukprot:QOY41276.1 hypothetical protein CPATCC_002954 [Cryptosporidium parvum]
MRERNSRRKIKPVYYSPSENEDSNEEIDEIESLASQDGSIRKRERIHIEEGSREINDMVESIDLTLVVWLRKMYCKYNQPYLTCLDCLEHSNYTTRLAEELLMSKFGAK